MLTTIICNTREDSNYVYDLLVSKVHGNGALKGSKQCIDPHELLDQGMTFDLTFEEIEELKKIPQVLSVKIEEPTEVNFFSYTKKSITGFPRLANKNPNTNQLLSHSLLYGQDYSLKYIQDNSTKQMTLSTIDCSNVDIIVIDSGIDGNHPDLTDDNGNKLLVEFQWGKLEVEVPANLFTQGATGVVKLTQNRMPANYYTTADPNGHGTACASLIVGKRCGFARNAKLYSLKGVGSGDSFLPGSAETALKLVLAFLKAKKQNLHGLNSTRPTIISNSWGIDLALLNPDHAKTINANELIDENHKLYIKCIGDGEKLPSNHADPQQKEQQNVFLYSRAINGQNSLLDEYTRKILDEGGHFIRAAGNTNCYYDLNSPVYSWHLFSRGNSVFHLLKTKDNFNKFVANKQYGQYTYRQERLLRLYSSPDVGINEQTNKPYDNYEYPIIIVGDVIPIGDSKISNSDYAASSQDSKVAYDGLINLQKNTEEQRIKLNKNLRYTSRKGPFFVKSSYSNYGPSIDICATGNGTWAAHSSTTGVETPIAEYTSPDNSSYKYKWFNGTSAACPIVSGILATFLSQYPTATPRQAKEWLIKNAVRGNIMETTKTEVSIKTTTGDSKNNKEITTKMPHGSKYELINPQKPNIEMLLFRYRFFDTANLMPQAFPLRKAILAYEDKTVTLGNATLTKGKETKEAITHKP